MKIAFIDHLPVGTGIVRYATQLAQNLVLNDSTISVDYYTHSHNYKTNPELFTNRLFKVYILTSTEPLHIITKIRNKVRRRLGIKDKDKLAAELYGIEGYDVYYFTSAHMSPFYRVKGKAFATFHDFNWKYAFGLPNFSKKDVQSLHDAMEKWLSVTVPVVSSAFMEKELLKFYGKMLKKVEVIYLPNLASESESGFALLPKEVVNPYLLYPASTFSHKNHFNLYRALYKLKGEGNLENLKLVMTGLGTDHFKYAKLCNEGIAQADESDYDVIGLGYVNNNQMDALIKNAVLNISVSLYEAGSGPALDAWINEAPVIISNIESHLDQLSFFNIECMTFDPSNPDDIADKISFALKNIGVIQLQSINAKQALKKYSWKSAAISYLNIFKKNGNQDTYL